MIDGFWRPLWSLIRVLAFGTIVTLIFVYLIAANDQGRDLVRMAVEEGWGAGAVVLAAAVVYGLNAWYWARLATYTRVRTDLRPRYGRAPRGEAPAIGTIERAWPRVLGVLPLLALAWVFGSLTLPWWPAAFGMALATVVLAGVLFAFFVYRRRLFGLPSHGAVQAGATPGGRSPARQDASPDEIAANARQIRSLPQTAVGLVVAFLLSLPLVLLVTVLAPVAVPFALGTLAVFLLWASAITGLVTILSYLGRRSGLPLTGVVVGVALLLGSASGLSPNFTDNHAIRMDGTGFAGTADDLPDVTAYTEAWLEERGAPAATADTPLPVFIVSTEGGGIRAGYWTALVLGRLAAAHPDFADHILAISSVSGGSLGSATFAAAAYRPPPGAPAEPPLALTDAYFRQEYLSPILTAFLVSDLVQRIVPYPIHVFDRARAFELGLEAGWTQQVPGGADSNPLRQSLAVWSEGTASGDLPPILAFNTTRAGTGSHGVAAQVRLDGHPAFLNTVDLSCLAPDMPLSTAVHLTARFPLVSPAGRVVRTGTMPQVCPPADSADAAEADRLFRFVDGGYYDNSGVITAGNVRAVLDTVLAQQGWSDRVAVYHLHIGNDPAQPGLIVTPSAGPGAGDGGHCNVTFAGVQPPPPPGYALGDLLSPVRALLGTRTERGFETLEQFCTDQVAAWSGDGPPAFLEFRLGALQSTVPLGWALSRSSKNEMELALATAEQTAETGTCPADPGDDIADYSNCLSWRWVAEAMAAPR